MAFTVKLNGSNYVSDKTESAFEKALGEGPKIGESPQENGNGNGNGSHPVQAAAPQPAQPASLHRPTANYGQILDSLERGLAHAYEHQQMTLQVHERYLTYQSDYAEIFSQLMQQQGAIFAQTRDPQQAQTAVTVLETLSRSMERFHELQAETLSVHKLFLGQQADYSQSYVRILDQQHRAMVEGKVNTNGNGSHPVQAAAPLVEAPSPQAPIVRERSEAIPAPEPPQVVQAETPAAPEPAAPAPTLDTEALSGVLLAIVSDKTGYPAEMLDLEMDLEADLGIDSIKRVEILGALQDQRPELPTIETGDLAELRTLGQILDYIAEKGPADSKKA